MIGRKAPSARRRIKTLSRVGTWSPSISQKAPSTKRCIKTDGDSGFQGAGGLVRKHPAPQGALRQVASEVPALLLAVRKHPAPQGALRRTI